MEKVLEISKQIWKAMQEQDIEFLKNQVYPNAVFVHMGATMSRDEEIEVITKKGIVYKEIVFEETNVQQMDKTTVVLTKMKLTAVVGGNEVTNSFVVTEVYTNHENGFKLASQSYTKIIY